MSQIAELTKIISARTQELEKSTEQAIESELKKLKSATTKHSNSVTKELVIAIRRQKRLIKAITISVIVTWVVVLVMSLSAIGAIYLGLKSMKQEIEKTQNLVNLNTNGVQLRTIKEGTFVVVPPGTNCMWTVENKPACKLPQ